MTKLEIEQWLKHHAIEDYIIHDNLVVDVYGNVDLSARELDSLPFQFGKVFGFFSCDKNNLVSLKHCPFEVDGDFYCHNNKLTSLGYMPTTITGIFSCWNNTLVLNNNNISEWMAAIKNNKDVYSILAPNFKLLERFPELEQLQKMLWEV